MFDMVIALAAIQAAASTMPAVPAAPAFAVPARKLQDVPGIAITYRDLSEKDVKAINKLLSKNKPLTAEQQAMLGAKTNWTASGRMTRRTTGTQCVVTNAEPDFKAMATLPRFNEAWIPANDLPAWRAYASAMESQAAAKLWFPVDRLPAVQQAVLGKPCDQAMKDGAAAIEKIKAEAAAFQPPIQTTAPAAAQ